MDHCYLLQIFLLILLFTLASGRALFYDQLDDEPIDQLSKSSEEHFDLKSKPNKISAANDADDDRSSSSLDIDSYEEVKSHRRAVLSSPRSPYTISPQTRQVLLDILQKAYDQGWRPQLKHYIPATRFGRHRR